MAGYNVIKDYKPKFTIWSKEEVQDAVTRHKRACRRAYKQYLRTGDIRDLDRSEKLITRLYFD